MVFRPGANSLAVVVVWGAVLAVFGTIGFVWTLPRTDYLTEIGFVRNQPVPFSHKHHVAGLGIDCRYCHYTVERAASAGMPTTDTCMTCHSQIWTNAPMLAPVRQSLAEHRPLIWQRITHVPDYVYFNHSIHIAKGIGCETCHGRVDRMPLAWRTRTLHMSWCLGCHRDPAPNLRPRSAIFEMGWKRGPGTPSPSALMSLYHVRTQGLTDCTVCHR